MSTVINGAPPARALRQCIKDVDSDQKESEQMALLGQPVEGYYKRSLATRPHDCRGGLRFS